MPPRPPPAIALVPGFLGFEHRTSTTYFADRFVAGLRSALAGLGEAPLPVIALSTLPISSLAKRQHLLLEQLRTLEHPMKLGPRSWHLIGHSTGGLDAALLLRKHPLEERAGRTDYSAGDWGKKHELVMRVRSVTSIAAPHWGTTLADSPLARFAEGHPSSKAARDFVVTAFDAVAGRDQRLSRLEFAAGSSPAAFRKLPRFLCDLIGKNALARDLSPAVSCDLSAAPVRTGMKGRVLSVVTCTPRPGCAAPDKLFRDLWEWTKLGDSASALPPETSVHDDPELRLPSQRAQPLPSIESFDNDGVVNSTRQVLGEQIALVLGDHADVLGRYRRPSLLDKGLIDPGLLTSGARFGDDAFFELVLLLARRLKPLL